MNLDREHHRRRSIRLRGYDYTQAGAYFVTVCALNRESLFGQVIDGVVELNDVGRIVENTWTALPERFPFLDLDEFIVMPNHFHGIIVLQGDQVHPQPEMDASVPGFGDRDAPVGAGLALPCLDGRGAASSAPTHDRAPAPAVRSHDRAPAPAVRSRDHPPALGDVLRAFKSISAIEANRVLGRSGQPLWQRNYYEHIIREEQSLDGIRRYIADNPARWAFDRENPLAARTA